MHFTGSSAATCEPQPSPQPSAALPLTPDDISTDNDVLAEEIIEIKEEVRQETGHEPSEPEVHPHDPPPYDDWATEEADEHVEERCPVKVVISDYDKDRRAEDVVEQKDEDDETKAMQLNGHDPNENNDKDINVSNGKIVEDDGLPENTSSR